MNLGKGLYVCLYRFYFCVLSISLELFPNKKLLKFVSFYIFGFIYLFVIFWLHWVFITAWSFSSYGKWGLPSSYGAQASHCGGFSLQSTGSRPMGFSRCHVQALELSTSGTQA